MDRTLYRTLLLFAAVALSIWAFGLVLEPFLVAISWALCLVAVTFGAYTALVKRWRKRRIAAGLMVFATALVIVLPLLVAVLLLVGEVSRLAEGDLQAWVKQARTHLPNATSWANQQLAHFDTDLERAANEVARSASSALPRVAAAAGQFLGGIFGLLFGLVIMLATQYFTYIDATRLKTFVRDVLPLSHEDTDRVLETLHKTTVAALVGGILVAAIQGVLGGIGFLIVGIGAPVLWSLVMAFFSLIPFGGTALVWAPAAIYLFATGETGHAWFLVGWGALVVGGADNLLRPWLLRRSGAEAVHPLLLFFAVISGIGLFGMSGVLFGPLLIALLTTIATIYREHAAPLVRSEA